MNFFFFFFFFSQHFMRTGTCKFGASCKYHHPRQGGGGGSVAPVSLSYLGYPLRPVCLLISLMVMWMLPHCIV